MIAVIVDLDVKPDRLDDFLPRMRMQAENSMTLEPQCHRFDVLNDPEEPGRFMLYEVYEDRAGFDAHLKTDHFHDFDAAVSEMLVSKSLRILDIV